MSGSIWILLLCLLAVTWITVVGLGTDQSPSTKTTDGDMDDEDDDNGDDEDDDDEADDGPELLIASIRHSPYLEDGASQGEFVGVIPDLLQAMCDTGHMSCDYDIELVTDGLWGQRDNQGRWSGMIGEVKRGEVDFAAAAITISEKRSSVVNFSIPFETLGLAVVANKADGIESIEDLLAKNITLGGIGSGTSLDSLRNHPEEPYASMWSKIDSNENSRVANMQEGIDRVLVGGYAMVGEYNMARYYVHRHCSLMQVGDTFLWGREHAFAFPKDNDNLEYSINTAIKLLKHDNKIDEIYTKWFDDVTCGAASVMAVRAAMLAIVALLVLL